MPGMLFESVKAFEQFRRQEALDILGLTGEPREYLKSIMERGARFRMTEEDRKIQEYQRFFELVSFLYEEGLVPSFEVVEE